MASDTAVNSQITDALTPEPAVTARITDSAAGGPESTVNPQITDAVTQTNVQVLGDAPAVAMGNLFQASAQATALSMQNAVSAQQQLNTLAQAVSAQAINQLFAASAAAPAATPDKSKGKGS